MDIVVEHLRKAEGRVFLVVFKNARLLNTRAPRGFTAMTLIAVTYGYARVSKADDESKNLDPQLMLLAEHGIRPDLVYSDVASGRNL